LRGSLPKVSVTLIVLMTVWIVTDTSAASAQATSNPAPDADSMIVKSVVVGAQHTCVLTEARQALCWGGNASGQVGVVPSTSVRVPTRPQTPPLRALAAGAEHTCALDVDGKAWCWGSNKYGQLGHRRGSMSFVPQSVRSDVAFTAITAGANHTCALGIDQLAYCWGDQWDRAVGSFDAGDNVREPLAVQGAHKFASLSAGASHTCGLGLDGKVMCWGDNSAGQLGIKTSRRLRFAPGVVTAVTSAKSVSAGNAFSCALGDDGAVSCWGKAPTGAPRVTQLHLRALSAGATSACGITDRGRLACWGGDATALTAPRGIAFPAEQQSAGDEYVQIASGSSHSCAVTTRERLVCWGDNGAGQLGPAALR
jgi:alpha-tubulin suppressor-like RCC1 family protein